MELNLQAPHIPPQPLAIFFLLLLHDRIHFSINSSFFFNTIITKKVERIKGNIDEKIKEPHPK